MHKTELFIFSFVCFSSGIACAASEISSEELTFDRRPPCPSTLQAQCPAMWAGGKAGIENSTGYHQGANSFRGLPPEDRGPRIAGFSGYVGDCRRPGGMRTHLWPAGLQCVLQQCPSVSGCQVEICWGPTGGRTPCL